jgi:hypothetical protein
MVAGALLVVQWYDTMMLLCLEADATAIYVDSVIPKLGLLENRMMDVDMLSIDRHNRTVIVTVACGLWDLAVNKIQQTDSMAKGGLVSRFGNDVPEEDDQFGEPTTGKKGPLEFFS